MLHHRPSGFEPAGTRPWISGSGFEPGPHDAWGVAANGGSGRVMTGTVAGVCPTPWPRAKRSLIGPSGPWAPAAGGSARTAAISAHDRTESLLTHLDNRQRWTATKLQANRWLPVRLSRNQRRLTGGRTSMATKTRPR